MPYTIHQSITERYHQQIKQSSLTTEHGLERIVPFVLQNAEEKNLISLHLSSIDAFAHQEKMTKGLDPIETKIRLLDLFFRHKSFCDNIEQGGCATLYKAWEDTISKAPAQGLPILFDKCVKFTTGRISEKLESRLRSESQKATRIDFRILARHIEKRLTKLDIIDNKPKTTESRHSLEGIRTRCENLKNAAVLHQVKGIKAEL